MVVLEAGQIVDILIDNNVEVIRLVMRRNVGGCESLGHAGRGKARWTDDTERRMEWESRDNEGL